MANKTVSLSSFPVNPSDGQEVSIDGRKWIYKSSIPGWICVQVGSGGMIFVASSTAPSVDDYKAGDRWFNTSTGVEYALIHDEDSRYWVNVYVTPHSHSISSIINLQSILNMKNQFYYSSSPPEDPSIGDRWVDVDNGEEYVYVYNGSTYQWMQPIVRNFMGNVKLVEGATYTAASGDYYIGVNYAGNATIKLPKSPESGKMIIVKDESGNASWVSRSIRIEPFSLSDSIDGTTHVILNIDNGSLTFIYRSGWRII
jgi:hypothetical protein